jgi:putative ATP-binding cassette transporter
LTNDNSLLSQSIPRISVGVQMAAIVAFAVIYMAFISPVSFIISVTGIIIGAVYFLQQSKKIRKSRIGIINYETEYFGSISHLLNGFKEIKINQAKSESLYKTVAKNAEETKQLKIDSAKAQAKIGGAGRTVVFSLLPLLIFIVPVFNHEQTLSIYKITASMLFIYGPLGILFESIALFAQIDVVLDDLYALEKDIDEAKHQGQIHPEVCYADFKEITVTELCFSYPKQKDADAFSLGPISEKITAGELLFIIGGNGSGKSTFLKLLVGLYYPTQGSIHVDQKRMTDETYQDYRNLFSIIFTDFHLFDRLYGIENVDHEKVDFWLKKMRMDKIVSFKNGRFTNTDLSTGQRKRLAFIAAIMEDKPILILDEFAADQDPAFRKYFYEEILKDLKKMGKTVIAVTHDDHYFHVPDRLLKMDSAHLLKFNPGHPY